MSSRSKQLYKFDRFLLDAGERVLLRDGQHVPLTPKAFETLLVFVRNNGRIMEKDDLLKKIWPDTFVEEATLAQNVFTLRKALNQASHKGQDKAQAAEHRYIETIPRRGYRFLADVHEVEEETPAPLNETGEEEASSVAPHPAREPFTAHEPVIARSNMDETENSAVYSQAAQRAPHGGHGDDVHANGNGQTANAANGQASAAAQDVKLHAGRAWAGDDRRSGVERSHPKLGALLIASVVVVAALGATFALYKFTVRRQSDAAARAVPSSFDSMKVTRLAINGKAEEAAISPDGKYVAYLTNDAGRRSIWIRQAATTNSNAQQIVPAAESGGYGGIVFSQDSEHIYFVAWQNTDVPSVLYQVPVFGGPPKKILSRINSYVSLSPDGRQLAFLRVDYAGSNPVTNLMIASADGSAERILTTRVAPEHLGEPAWSPDGATLVYPLKNLEPTPGSATLVETRLSDGKERQITAQRWHNIWQLMWLRDGSGLVMNAAEQELSPVQLWLLSYPAGEVRRVTNDLNSYAGASLTADATTLVTLQTDLISNVWVAPDGDASRAAQITQGTGKYDGYYGLSWTPDGRIVYASIASGAWDIWIMNADGSNQRQLTVDARSNYGPSVSADGRHIVFISNRAGGAFNVWRMDIDGANPRQLTNGKGENFAHISPDGRWVIYATVGFSHPNHVWKVPFDGGEPVRLTDRNASWPFISPDGKQFVCTYQAEPSKPYKLAVISFDGGPPVKLFDLSPTAMMNIVWLPDGRGITYIDNHGGVNNLWLQPTDGGAPKPITGFKSEGVGAYDWSPDGKRLACSRGIENSGVVLIKNFR
ncbi:MAG TPA: DPP IV N-terminal domain-containing protein [Pyrinomonadaceae bacterium]|nr:DPP IV N-terminal domain-containing protein [Pyrinomonadaceae bacterium]